MATKQKPKPPYLILQIKRTFYGKVALRLMPYTKWLQCPNPLAQVLLANSQRVIDFDSVRATTDCWELKIEASLKKGDALLYLGYAKKSGALEVHTYLTNAISLAEAAHKQKKQSALAGNPLTYPTHKERG